jgi:hypothetical protein
VSDYNPYRRATPKAIILLILYVWFFHSGREHFYRVVFSPSRANLYNLLFSTPFLVITICYLILVCVFYREMIGDERSRLEDCRRVNDELRRDRTASLTRKGL